MGMRFLLGLGIDEVELQLNSLGDIEERGHYRESLVGYFNARRDKLCPDCLRRLDTNPLRVLDCKIAECIEMAAEAPMMLDHLGDESRSHFEQVCNTLDDFGLSYVINKRIVRGLDYYNRTAFEYKAGSLGAQDAVGGGGRYDGLVQSLGGVQTPAVGFALGVERIAMLMENQVQPGGGLDFYLIAVGENCIRKGCGIAEKLRGMGLSGEVDLSGRRLKHLFARAERRQARACLIIGDDELAAGIVKVKNMQNKTQKEIAIDDLGPEAVK